MSYGKAQKFQSLAKQKTILEWFSKRQFSSKKSKKDKEEECCPKCPEQPKVEQYVQEKSCEPCCFESWTPQCTCCLENDMRKLPKEKKKIHCYPGMVIKMPYSDCKKEDIDPFKKKLCKGPAKMARPKPPIPPTDELKLPEPDWDTNCSK